MCVCVCVCVCVCGILAGRTAGRPGRAIRTVSLAQRDFRFFLGGSSARRERERELGEGERELGEGERELGEGE